jgi:MFS family permease
MHKDLHEFRDGWRALLASTLGVGIGLTGAPFYTMGIFLGPLGAAFGWSRAQLSGGALCLHLGYAFTAPFMGRLIDRIGVRKVALTSLLGLTVGLCLMTQIGPNIASFYGLLLLMAVLGCGTIPTVWAYAVSTWFQNNRGFALSLTLTGTGLASLGAPLAVNALITHYGWWAGYLGLAAFAAFVVIPAVWFFLSEKTGQKGAAHGWTPRSPGISARDALETVRFWQLLLGVSCMSLGTGALILHLVPMLTDAGLARSDAVGIVGLLGLAVIAGRLTVGAFVDHIHGPYVAIVYLMFPVIGCLVMAGAAITPGVAIFGVLMIGLAAGAEVDLIAFLTSKYFGLKSYGELYGWQLVVFALGAGFGPLLSGWARDTWGSYEVSLYAGAAAFSLGAALIGTLGRYPVFVADPSEAVTEGLIDPAPAASVS